MHRKVLAFPRTAEVTSAASEMTFFGVYMALLFALFYIWEFELLQAKRTDILQTQRTRRLFFTSTAKNSLSKPVSISSFIWTEYSNRSVVSHQSDLFSIFIQKILT